jgi:hypothetical protein
MPSFGSAGQREESGLVVDKTGGVVGAGSSNLTRRHAPTIQLNPVLNPVLMSSVGRALPTLAIAGGAVGCLAMLLGQKPDQQLLQATIESQKVQTQQLAKFEKVLATATRPNIGLINIGSNQPAFQPQAQEQPPIQYYQPPAQVSQVSMEISPEESEYQRLSTDLVNDYPAFQQQYQTWYSAMVGGSPEPTAAAFRRISREQGWVNQ